MSKSSDVPCCLQFRYGVWADWERPYITMQPEFEAAQLRVFGAMFLNGHIYRLVHDTCSGIYRSFLKQKVQLSVHG